MNDRRRALGKLSAEHSIVFTETEAQALERKKRLTCSEIETAHPVILARGIRLCRHE